MHGVINMYVYIILYYDIYVYNIHSVGFVEQVKWHLDLKVNVKQIVLTVSLKYHWIMTDNQVVME